MKENLYGFCGFHVDVCRDDDVFVVTRVFCRRFTLQFVNFDLFWFARGIGCTVKGAPIGSGYSPFFFCNVEGSVCYLPSQVLAICDAYVDPHEKLEVEFDVFPPFVFVVTVITICSVLIVPLGLFEVNEGYVTLSTSLEPIGLEFLEGLCRDGCVYVGGGPGVRLGSSFPFPFFA